MEQTVNDLMKAEPTPEGIYPLLLSLSTAAIGFDFQGYVRKGSDIMVRLTELVNRALDRVPGIEFYSIGMWGMRAAVAYQDPDRGYRDTEHAKAICVALGHYRFSEIFDLLGGMNLWLLGAYQDAEHKFLGLRLPDEEFGYVAASRRFCYGWMLADRNELEQAKTLATQLVESGKARKHLLDQGRGHWILAEVLRRAGEFHAAHTEIESALQILRMACPLDVPGALATRAAMYLSWMKLDEALASAEEGMSHYKRMGACSLFFREAFLSLVHAECLDALGRREDAKTAIEEASADILANAQKIQNPAYRRAFLEDVPENKRTFELWRQWQGLPT